MRSLNVPVGPELESIWSPLELIFTRHRVFLLQLSVTAQKYLPLSPFMFRPVLIKVWSAPVWGRRGADLMFIIIIIIQVVI